jgi:hypothetical protein
MFHSSKGVREDEIRKFDSYFATAAVTDVNSSSFPLEAVGASDKR